MTCLNLNEEVYHKIENVLDNPKKETFPTVETYFKSIYGPATLMNDWYEKRYAKFTETVSQPRLSENMDAFRAPCKTFLPDRQAYFDKIFDGYDANSQADTKLDSPKNTLAIAVLGVTRPIGLGQELLTDHLGFSYYDNYTTTSDLMFNHLRKGICGPVPRHYVRGVYKPEADLMKIFGNLTQWGLKEKVYASMEKEELSQPKDTSETLAQFVPYDQQTIRKFNDFKTFRRVKAVY